MKSRILVGGDEEKSISGKGVKSQNAKYSVTGASHASQNKASLLNDCKDWHPTVMYLEHQVKKSGFYSFHNKQWKFNDFFAQGSDLIRFVIWKESYGGSFNNGIGIKQIRGQKPVV